MPTPIVRFCFLLQVFVMFGVSLVSFGVWAVEARTAEKSSTLFALDLDSLFNVQKASLYKDSDELEQVMIKGVHYRVPLFLPEFIMALRYLFPNELAIHGRLAVFSAADVSHNQRITLNFPLNKFQILKDLLEDIRTFEDLTVTKDFDPRVGGQFFESYKKDLTQLSDDLKKVVLFDDNINATPEDQVGNILLIARPDIYENQLRIRGNEPNLFWAPDQDARNPVQIARSRYRLVRAAGLLSQAVYLVNQGMYQGVVDALQKIQWTEDGQFRHIAVNDEDVYKVGIQTLQAAYHLYLQTKGASSARHKEYFTIKPVSLRANRCDRQLGLRRGYLPWERYAR